MRCTDLAFKKLFTMKQWREIEDEAKYRTVTIDKVTNKSVWTNNFCQPKENQEEPEADALS